MAISYTEFYCRSSGSNSNSGSTDSDTPFITYTGGSWNSSTYVFDPAGAANPSTDGVTVGMWANIGGTFVARITAVSSSTFTVSSTYYMGPVPATGTLTAVIGGRWKGPNGTDGWPFSATSQGCEFLQNASGHPCRINMHDNASYSMTTGITATTMGGVVQGMTSTPGDGGRATIYANAAASFTLLTSSGQVNLAFRDLIFESNHSSGTSYTLLFTGSAGNHVSFFNCIFKNLRAGVSCGSSGMMYYFEKCEFASLTNNAIGNVNAGAFVVANNCVFHDCTGTALAATQCVAINCIFDTVSTGIAGNSGSNTMFVVKNCDFYNTTNDGISSGTGKCMASVMNCNFFKCGAYGIDVDVGLAKFNMFFSTDNAFGAGTEANATANYRNAFEDLNAVTYTSNQTPWDDPSNGDFSLVGSACIDTGYNSFTQTTASYGPTTAYAHIGAAGASGGGGGSTIIVTDY